MRHILTTLLICASTFGMAFTAARSGHPAPAPESTLQSQVKSSGTGTSATNVRHDAGAALKALLNDLLSAREKIEAMTPEQIRACLDALCSTMRLDSEAAEAGEMLVTAWAMRDPFAAFHWCQARHSEFAGVCVPLFESMASTDPEQAYACCAKLKTSSLRVSALQAIAHASRPDDARATLDRLLAFGDPGETAAQDWLIDLSTKQPDLSETLVKMLRSNTKTSPAWRSLTPSRMAIDSLINGTWRPEKSTK